MKTPLFIFVSLKKPLPGSSFVRVLPTVVASLTGSPRTRRVVVRQTRDRGRVHTCVQCLRIVPPQGVSTCLSSPQFKFRLNNRIDPPFPYMQETHMDGKNVEDFCAYVYQHSGPENSDRKFVSFRVCVSLYVCECGSW